MQTFTTAQLREKLKGSAEGEDEEKVAEAADGIEFLEFSDLEKSVKEEVEFVKAHPLIVKETEVTGWVYHVESGKVCGDHGFRQTACACVYDEVRTGSSGGLNI